MSLKATFSSAATAVINPFAAADANGDGYSDLYTASFLNGSLTATVSLVTGTATATTTPFSLPAGTAALTATWPGNINFNGSTATGNPNRQRGPPVTLTLASSKNPSNTGDAVTFTATVVPNPANATLPTGTISILVDNAIIGQGQPSANGTFNRRNLHPPRRSPHRHRQLHRRPPSTPASPPLPSPRPSAALPAVAPTLAWSPRPHHRRHRPHPPPSSTP